MPSAARCCPPDSASEQVVQRVVSLLGLNKRFGLDPGVFGLRPYREDIPRWADRTLLSAGISPHGLTARPSVERGGRSAIRQVLKYGPLAFPIALAWCLPGADNDRGPALQRQGDGTDVSPVANSSGQARSSFTRTRPGNSAGG